MSKSAIKRAVAAHTDLNVFAAVVSLLEGGHLYSGGGRVPKTAQRIIAICQKEQQALLREYDSAAAEVYRENADV